MHSCRLLMEIPSTERHRAIHDIIAIGVLKGIGGEHQFRILRILRIISFFSRSIDSSEQANQPRKIDRFGFFDFSVRKWSFSKLNDGLICKNRTKNQNDNRPQERIEKNWEKQIVSISKGKFLISNWNSKWSTKFAYHSNAQNYQENVLGTRLNLTICQDNPPE